MKIRNGFVSNSSSSSFIVAFESAREIISDKYPWISDSKSLWEKIESELIYLPGFSIIFKQGTSGDCEPMLVVINDSIRDYIIDKQLFTKYPKFTDEVYGIVFIKKLINKDKERVGDRLIDYKNFLNSLVDASDDTYISFNEIYDHSSLIEEEDDKLYKFRKFVEEYILGE